MKKLNEHDVRRIREVYYGTDTTIGDLSDKYDVSYGCIQAVVRGENWQHVGGPTSVDPDEGYTTNSQKLTDEDVKEIKHRRGEGESLASIASDFPVGKTQVCNLTSGCTGSSEKKSFLSRRHS